MGIRRAMRFAAQRSRGAFFNTLLKYRKRYADTVDKERCVGIPKKGEKKMSINPIAATDAARVAAPPAPVDGTQAQFDAPKPPQANPHPVPADTVKISSAAKNAEQEATETAAQTAREASGGDPQAQRLLAREAAAEEANKSPAVQSQEAQGTSISGFFR